MLNRYFPKSTGKGKQLFYENEHQDEEKINKSGHKKVNKIRFDAFDIMAMKDLREPFLKFTEARHSEENYNFIDQVIQLQQQIDTKKKKIGLKRTKKKHGGTKEQIDKKIKDIYTTFIEEEKKGKEDFNELMSTSKIYLVGEAREKLEKDYNLNYWPDYPLSMKYVFFNEACRKCREELTPVIADWRLTEEFKELESKKYRVKLKEKSLWQIVAKKQAKAQGRFEKNDAEQILNEIRQTIIEAGPKEAVQFIEELISEK